MRPRSPFSLLPALILALPCCAHPPQRSAAERLAPLLLEVLRFPTVEGNAAAQAAQKQWLFRTAAGLGLTARDAGKVTEIELPGPPGAPVLGLVVHGDVQPVDDRGWTVPPFAGVLRDGMVYGRGAADDKGPLVQALLAMQALAATRRTHTIRLLVGSDEESGSSDMKEYLAGHEPPAYSLVLDSDFPVVVGEKAWDGLATIADDRERGEPREWEVVDLEAGLAPSIVPDRARLVLRWKDGPPRWDALKARLFARPPDDGTTLELAERLQELELLVHGRSAHAGVNLAGGRNALVSLAHLAADELPACGARDVLQWAAFAGSGLHGEALGLASLADSGWGGWSVNVAQITRHPKLPPEAQGKLTLVINLRRPPPLTAAQSRAHLFEQVKEFNARTGTALIAAEYYFQDTPLVFDRNGKLVQRLLADYRRATGDNAPPTVSGGGTYAKRIPRAIAFGMWFAKAPYPGHDADEKIPLVDLQRGLVVLVETLRDLATTAPMVEPFQPEAAPKAGPSTAEPR